MAFQGFPVKIFLQNQFREGLRVTVPVFAGDFIINRRNMFPGARPCSIPNGRLTIFLLKTIPSSKARKQSSSAENILTMRKTWY